LRSIFVAQTETPDVEETFNELSQLTATDWLIAGAIVVGAIAIGFLIRVAISRVLSSRGQLVSRLVSRLAFGLVVALGFVYALNQVGVSIGPVLGLLGLFGLALALAFQEVLGNFIAGIMLSLQRPFRVGDEIRTSDYEGTVEDVSLRTTTVHTFDGVQVYIPNSEVWTNAIENSTETELRRTTLPVGVSYNTDLDSAQELILETVRGLDDVAEEPAPQAFVHEFGDSSINYAVRFWHESSIATEWRVRDEAARALKRALDDAGVEIPFPQLDLHLQQVPADLATQRLE
jgi:small conductance mechanosensitive channel